jgi:hypothetical protein
MFRINHSFVFNTAVVAVLALGLAGGVSRSADAQSRNLGFRGHHTSFIGGFGSHHFSHGTSFFGSFGFRPSYNSFLSFSFGNCYPYYDYYPYYSRFSDPFYYSPSYYPAYRTVYVDDRPIYVERDGYDRRTPGAVRGDDDYYLYRRPSPLKRDPSLSDALSDIEAAFTKDDPVLLERHVDAAATISVRGREKSAKSLKGSEYLEMTRGAIAEMKTITYKLDSVDLVREGEARVYGIHTLKTDKGDEKRFEVSFLLKKIDDKWMIVEAGAGAAR